MKKFKSSLIPIYQVLKKYSDEDHILSISQIFDLLSKEYQISIDRRTFYAHIELLDSYNIEVSKPRENKKGYFLQSRLIEVPEISILTQELNSAHYLYSKYSNDLIEKLLSTLSVYDAQKIKNSLIKNTSHKTKHKGVTFNIEMLLKAIQNRKMVSLQYCEYDYKKELKLKREKKYLLHPYTIVVWNASPYLICKSGNHEDLSFYRIDLMKDVKILDDDRKENSESIDPYKFIKNRTYMFTGETERVVLKCEKHILNNVIDTFGFDVTIKADPEDENKFLVYLVSAKTGLLYWVSQFMSFVEIIEPLSYKNDFVKMLEETLDKYKK